MYGVIGFGGAGGNIADEAAKRGFLSGSINFSERDLKSLKNVKHKLKLLGSEGVGHNRNEAISLLAEHHELAISFVKEHFINPSVDIILIPFSTGGGTGAGIAPILIELCANEFPDKVFVAIPIIPDNTEVTMSQTNCSKTFEELSRLNVAVFPVDNQKVRNRYPHIGRNKLWEKVNSHVVDMFEILYRYTERHSKDGNYDRKDLINTLLTSGIGIIAHVNINCTVDGVVDLSKNGVAQRIKQSWEDSIFAQVEYDRVVSAAIITDGDENIMSFIDPSIIFDEFSNGNPIDLFEGNYHDGSGEVLTVLTGLAWSKSRMIKVDELIREGETKIKTILNQSSTDTYQSSATDIINRVRSKSGNSSIADILGKYKR